MPRLSHLAEDGSGEGVGPSGAFAFAADGDAGPRGFEDAEGEFAQDGEVFRGVILAVAGAILVEGGRYTATQGPHRVARTTLVRMERSEAGVARRSESLRRCRLQPRGPAFRCAACGLRRAAYRGKAPCSPSLPHRGPGGAKGAGDRPLRRSIGCMLFKSIEVCPGVSSRRLSAIG